jgi:hypothetical protein
VPIGSQFVENKRKESPICLLHEKNSLLVLQANSAAEVLGSPWWGEVMIG